VGKFRHGMIDRRRWFRQLCLKGDITTRHANALRRTRGVCVREDGGRNGSDGVV
jgi:hypothetical protein